MGLLLAVAAPSAEFSHALHLRLVPACTGCHSSARSSTQASDNLLPKPEACSSCHKDVAIKAAPRPVAVSKFNHALHARLGNIAPVLKQAIRNKKHYLAIPDAKMAEHLETKNACGACHRGMETSAAATHPHMADCLVCHNKIDPPDSCQKCHSPAVAAKPANHTADFLDRHNSRNSGLDLTTCAVCHGRTFTCLGCH